MREWVRHRLTFANVCSALALFVAVAGGTAYAANTIGSSDVINESLRSEDIKNGEVKTSDLANNAVDTNKILDGGVKAADLGANSVVTTKIGPGEVKNSDLGDNSITSDKIAQGAVTSDDVQNNALTGTDIDESTLDVGAAALPTAVAGQGACSADDGSDTTCATATVKLPRPGRLAVTASGLWFTFAFDDSTGAGSDADSTTLVDGLCHLEVDGVPAGSATEMGESSPAPGTPATHPSNSPGTLAMTALSDNLTAGQHTVSLRCSESDGDIDWGAINLVATEVAPKP